MFEHFFESLANEARITLHILNSPTPQSDEEKIIEVCEVVGKAIWGCTKVDERRGGKVASSKGTLCA